jgi:hypothetical protein
MGDNVPKRYSIARVIVGLILGFVCGGLANYFVLRLFLESVNWHVVLFTEVVLGLLLAILALKMWRRGSALSPGVLLGIVLSIAAYWALLFWVVGI